jgi:2-keto-4-pentenoate hydratase/2-oxohepta-3-ene-1,7-dioic acid hydratase in catechol pathway
MQFIHFSFDKQKFTGILDKTSQTIKAFDISGVDLKYGVLPIIEMLSSGKELPAFKDEQFNLNDVEVLAPIPFPRRNIFCVGKNYLEHVKEVAASGLGSGANNNAADVPSYPIVFSKVPETVIATNNPIQRHRHVTNCLDYEAELAVIIGKEGRGINKENAMDYVFGYTIVNDVSARDLQKRHQQWHIAKSLDTFCPMGPVIVTKDEIDVANTSIKCWVNNELRQDGNTSQFIFDIPTIIENLSAGITLYPGDVIATGTPSGVGVGFVPPRFLDTADIIKIQVEGIGELVNVVIE